jgi:hypothetical protein
VSMGLCNCYVRYLSGETKFSVRYGSHNQKCPAYRESGDPVDRIADREFRERIEPKVLRSSDEG